MKRLGAALVATLWAIVPAQAVDGLVTISSRHGVKQTIDRLEATMKAGGATIIARVDHAAAGAGVSLPLRPTELLIFGNPKAGTPLMQAQQTMGIDLPLKALAYEDSSGKVWLTFNDPAWLAARHSVTGDGTRAASTIAAALAAAAETAAAP
jgi:uncharacterized protein (DUF302 family)